MAPRQPQALLRYALVGAVATAVHYLLLVVAVEALHWRPWLAAGFGAVVGAQVAFAGNRRFTFKHAGPGWPAWWRFQASAVGGAVLAAALVAGAVALGLPYLLGQVVATVLAMLATFAVNRHWSFAARPDRS